MRSDASSTWMSFLGAACVAPPALQFPAQTECTQLELRSCAGGPEHQFNNNNKSCKDTARNHFPHTSLLGKRLPKSFLLTDPPLIYRLKITVMEELPAWKALPSAVHQTWVSSFSQKAFITGPSEKLRARLCCLAWHRGAHRETYAEVLSCSGGSMWIGNSETEALSKAGLQPTPLWCTEGHCQVCGAFEIGEEASSRLRQEAKGADRILAASTETYCSVSEALIELNSGPEEFCSSTAKQLTTTYKPLLAQLTLFHVCCTLCCLMDPCTYPSGAWSAPGAEPRWQRSTCMQPPSKAQQNKKGTPVLRAAERLGQAGPTAPAAPGAPEPPHHLVLQVLYFCRLNLEPHIHQKPDDFSISLGTGSAIPFCQGKARPHPTSRHHRPQRCSHPPWSLLAALAG